MLTHLSLFSGIGGIDLSSEWAGFTTVGQCEFADCPTKVLEKHWPNVPRWRDIRDVTADSFRERTGLRTVDLISGGFPCQPFSVAGKQKGKGDDRYLWPEMLRVIREIKPTWVLGENVPGIIKLAGRTVCEDLEREGYDVAVFNFEAAAVGAPHRRERVFFVANAKSQQNRRLFQSGLQPNIGTSCKNVADTNNKRLQGWFSEIMPECASERIAGKSNTHVPDTEGVYVQRQYDRQRQEQSGGSSWWATEPGMGGMVDGLPRRLDGAIGWMPEPDIPRVATGVKDRVARLKALGNAVVPQQIYPILRAIAIIETAERVGDNKKWQRD